MSIDWPQSQAQKEQTGQLPPRARRRSVRETIAEAVPAPGQPGWKKFLGWIAALAWIVVGRKFGLAAEDIALGVGVSATYIGAQGIADFGKEGRGETRVEKIVVRQANPQESTAAPQGIPGMPPFKPGPGSGAKF